MLRRSPHGHEGHPSLRRADTPTTERAKLRESDSGGQTHLRPDPEVLGADGRLDGREHCRQRHSRQGHGLVARPSRGRTGRAVRLDSQSHSQRCRHGHQPERRATDCRGSRVGRHTAGRADRRGPAASIDVSWRPWRRLARCLLPSDLNVDVWQQRICGSCGPAVPRCIFFVNQRRSSSPDPGNAAHHRSCPHRSVGGVFRHRDHPQPYLRVSRKGCGPLARERCGHHARHLLVVPTKNSHSGGVPERA